MELWWTDDGSRQKNLKGKARNIAKIKVLKSISGFVFIRKHIEKCLQHGACIHTCAFSNNLGKILCMHDGIITKDDWIALLSYIVESFPNASVLHQQGIQNLNQSLFADLLPERKNAYITDTVCLLLDILTKKLSLFMHEESDIRITWPCVLCCAPGVLWLLWNGAERGYFRSTALYSCLTTGFSDVSPYPSERL